MANTSKDGYDTSIGTSNRSVTAATKLWAIVLGFIFLFGVIMLVVFLTQSYTATSSGPVSSENTASRPAEP